MTFRDYRFLQFDTPDAGVLRIVFSNPGRLNAVNAEMHTELVRVWRDVDEDPDVRAVIVTGADGAFSAGGDIELIDAMVNDVTMRNRALQEGRDIAYNIINCSKPIVSAIAGPAVGAGLAVGLLADISIATPTARIIDGHTRLGVVAGDHAALIWPLLCGLAKSRYYLLTCEPITGEEAERIGLVSLCVPDDRLQDQALQIARGLANGAPNAIRWTKLALNNWLRQAGPIFDASLAYELAAFGTPDAAEGLAALREKRPPNFVSPAVVR